MNLYVPESCSVADLDYINGVSYRDSDVDYCRECGIEIESLCLCNEVTFGGEKMCALHALSCYKCSEYIHDGDDPEMAGPKVVIHDGFGRRLMHAYCAAEEVLGEHPEYLTREQITEAVAQ